MYGIALCVCTVENWRNLYVRNCFMCLYGRKLKKSLCTVLLYVFVQ